MSALPRDAKTKLFKNADSIPLADSWNFRHSRLHCYEFRSDFLVFLRGFAPNVFLGDFQP